MHMLDVFRCTAEKKIIEKTLWLQLTGTRRSHEISRLLFPCVFFPIIISPRLEHIHIFALWIHFEGEFWIMEIRMCPNINCAILLYTPNNSPTYFSLLRLLLKCFEQWSSLFISACFDFFQQLFDIFQQLTMVSISDSNAFHYFQHYFSSAFWLIPQSSTHLKQIFQPISVLCHWFQQVSLSMFPLVFNSSAVVQQISAFCHGFHQLFKLFHFFWCWRLLARFLHGFYLAELLCLAFSYAMYFKF